VVISRLDVSLGLLGVVIVAHLSVVVVHRIGSLLLSCNVLFAKDLLNLGYFFTHVRCIPDSLDKDTSTVGGFPNILNVYKFIHCRPDLVWDELIHKTALHDIDILVCLDLHIIQMIVVDVNLVAQVDNLSLLDLYQAVFAVKIESLISDEIISVITSLLWVLTTSISWLFKHDVGSFVLLGREVVFFEPHEKEAPSFEVRLHPVTH